MYTDIRAMDNFFKVCQPSLTRLNVIMCITYLRDGYAELVVAHYG